MRYGIVFYLSCGSNESSDVGARYQGSSTQDDDSAGSETTDTTADWQDSRTDISFTDIDGVTFSLSEFQGSVVMIDFLRTDSDRCVERLQLLKELRNQFQPEGFEIIGVVMNMAGKDSIERLRQRHRLPFPVVQGAGVYDLGPWLSKSLPVTFIYDRKCRPASRIIGPEEKKTYEKQVRTVMDNS